MIDFTNKSIIKLKPMDNNEGKKIVESILIDSENVAFSSHQ